MKVDVTFAINFETAERVQSSDCLFHLFEYFSTNIPSPNCPNVSDINLNVRVYCIQYASIHVNKTQVYIFTLIFDIFWVDFVLWRRFWTMTTIAITVIWSYSPQIKCCQKIEFEYFADAWACFKLTKCFQYLLIIIILNYELWLMRIDANSILNSSIKVDFI